MAPWGLRRSRFVSIGMAGGGVILGAALLAMLISTPSAPFGVVLALLTLLLGIGGGIWVRRQAARVRLTLGDWGVRYEAPMVRIEAAWEDVAAVDQVLRGTETGPALVLTGDRMTSGRGLVGLVQLGGALEGTSVAGPSYRSTIPLAAFIEGRFVGSAVERDLRRWVPQLVDGFVLRHPDLVR